MNAPNTLAEIMDGAKPVVAPVQTKPEPKATTSPPTAPETKPQPHNPAAPQTPREAALQSRLPPGMAESPGFAESMDNIDALAAERRSTDFDWERDAGDIVQRSVGTVAVYLNPHGTIVIRQAQEWDEDADTLIYLSPACVPDVIARLRSFIDNAR
jgi:hypothetical protein